MSILMLLSGVDEVMPMNSSGASGEMDPLLVADQVKPSDKVTVKVTGAPSRPPKSKPTAVAPGSVATMVFVAA